MATLEQFTFSYQGGLKISRTSLPRSMNLNSPRSKHQKNSYMASSFLFLLKSSLFDSVVIFVFGKNFNFC